MINKKLFLSGILIVILLQLQFTNGSDKTYKTVKLTVGKTKGRIGQDCKIDFKPEYVADKDPKAATDGELDADTLTDKDTDTLTDEVTDGSIYKIDDGQKNINREYHKYTHQAGTDLTEEEIKNKIVRDGPIKITTETQKDLWFREYIPTVTEPADFKVMQFNMLADGLSGIYDDDSTGKAFDHMDKEQLNWEIRGKQIIEEMIRSGADIIVVEENDKFDEIYRGLNEPRSGRKFNGILMNKAKSPTQNLNKDPIMQKLLNDKERGPLLADGISIYWNEKKFEYNGKALNDYLKLNKERIMHKVPFNIPPVEPSDGIEEEFGLLEDEDCSQDEDYQKHILHKIDNLKYIGTGSNLIEMSEFNFEVNTGEDKEIFSIYTRVLKVNHENDVISGIFPNDYEDGLNDEDLQVKKVEGKDKKGNDITIFKNNGNEIKEPKEVYLAIKLRHKESFQDIVFVATHLKSEKTQIGERTRLYEAKYLMKKVKDNFGKIDPIIFCADMNAGQVPIKVHDTEKVYDHETYKFLTEEKKFFDSQEKLLEIDGVIDPYQQWTTAKVRTGTAAIMVEDYILYKNFKNQGQLTPVGYYSYPNLDEMSPLFLPATYYPSDHIAIVTGFKIETTEEKKAEVAPAKKIVIQERSELVIHLSMIYIILIIPILVSIVWANWQKFSHNNYY